MRLKMLLVNATLKKWHSPCRGSTNLQDRQGGGCSHSHLPQLCTQDCFGNAMALQDKAKEGVSHHQQGSQEL